MKILIVGASQGSGALAAAAALAQGHAVSAFARSPDKLALNDPKLRKVKGDFHNQANIAAAVPGHDAVIVTASASTLRAFKENPNYFSQGTDYIIAAMKASGVRRLVILSALGTGESRRLLPVIAQKLMIDLILKRPFADHERQEKSVRASGLDWVIVRPGLLTNGAATPSFQKKIGVEKVPNAISRANVAAFLVEAATTQTWLRQAVQIGG